MRAANLGSEEEEEGEENPARTREGMTSAIKKSFNSPNFRASRWFSSHLEPKTRVAPRASCADL
jgi:hypothetical protein